MNDNTAVLVATVGSKDNYMLQFLKLAEPSKAEG
jgi:hypothetical protein